MHVSLLACYACYTQTWQEVVTDEHAEEHKVVNDALCVHPPIFFKGHINASELKLDVFTQQPAGCQ
jgi:hypothetical protein